MRVNRIQNYNNTYSPAFGVKFRKKDIEKIIQDVNYRYDENQDMSIYPKIYTMIKYLEEVPGDIATIEYTTINNKGKDITLKNKKAINTAIENNKHINVQIQVRYGDKQYDYKCIGWDEEHKSPLKSLECATLAFDDRKGGEYHEDYVHMPKIIFDLKWWGNRHKTVDDVRKLAIDA